MAKILHCADFHLDAPFHDLTPAQASQRRQMQRERVVEIVEIANYEQCDLVLIAGDLFDSHKIFPETLELLTKTFSTCTCTICIVAGNHDYYSPTSSYATHKWSENVHIFNDIALKSIDFPEINTTIWGASFHGTSAPPLLDGFSVPHSERVNIGLFHGDFNEKNSQYSPISRENVELSGLDYLALGHVHKATPPLKIGKTTMSYAGCTAGRGFDELGEKGVYLCDIEKGKINLVFTKLGGITYEIYRVNVGNNPVDAIELALPRHVEHQVIRLILEGCCEDLDIEFLKKTFAPRCYALNVVDNTTPAVDIWSFAKEDGLKGLFLQELQQFSAKSPEEIALAAKFGLAVMDGREVF